MTPIPDRFSFCKIGIVFIRIRFKITNFDGDGCNPYFLILNTKGEILYYYSRHNPVKPQRSKKSKICSKKCESIKLTNTRSLLSGKKSIGK